MYMIDQTTYDSHNNSSFSFCILHINVYIHMYMQYVRLHYETCPELVLHLLLHEWKIRVPNLVISIVGGLANAPLQAKLQQVVKHGILRAAKTTGAWIVTNGLDIGR